MDKKISIVIPLFNYGKYVGECIESVLRQSVPAHEIIVVDDESTDNGADVVKKYPVKYIWQKNKGLSGARNTGIKEATGNFLMCLDSDDLLRENAIKEMMILANEKVIAQAGLMYFGTQVATFFPQGADLETMKHSNSIYCNSVFPKSLWESVGGYDESDIMRLGWEDYLFWYECMKVGATLKTSNYIALLYRRHGKTMTMNTTHPNLDKIKGYMKSKHPELIF